MPPSICQDFLHDIFGKHLPGIIEEGLIDCPNISSFDASLQNCKNTWVCQEKPYCRPNQTTFFDQFVLQYADILRHSMLKELRQDVGLGCPPGIFTTNASKSLNAALKRKVNYKETEWPDFNEAMKKLVLVQR